MKTSLELIKDKRQELKDLTDRMDVDRDIALMSAYTLKGIAEQLKDEALPGSVSVTTNKAGVFYDSYKSTLSTMKRQCLVEGLSDEKNHKAEQFADDLLYTLDQSLSVSLDLWFAEQICLRTGVGIKLQLDSERNFQPSLVDMRWCTYQEGRGRDYKWIADSTIRDGASIIEEYKNIKGVDLSIVPEDGKDLHFDDYWDGEKREVWVEERKLLTEENTYGCLPYVIVLPLIGTFIQDKGYIKHRYESIFWLNRNLYDEWHRLASLLQSMGIKNYKQPFAQEKEDPVVSDPYPDVAGQNQAYRKGEIPQPIEQPDLSRAFLQSWSNLNNMLEMGGQSDAEMGLSNLDRPGIWYTQVSAIRIRRIMPRINAISMMYSKIVQLAIKELKTIKGKPKLGRKKMVYAELPDLDDITIDYRLMPDDKVMRVVNEARSMQLVGSLSLYDRLKDVIQHEDPDGAIDRLRAEEAERANPIIFYYNMSKRLLDVAKTKTGDEKKEYQTKAKYMADMMKLEIRKAKLQELALTRGGQAQPQKEEAQKGNSGGMLAISGMLGSGGGGKKPAEEVAVG